jgi:hypothetical protein
MSRPFTSETRTPAADLKPQEMSEAFANYDRFGTDSSSALNPEELKGREWKLRDTHRSVAKLSFAMLVVTSSWLTFLLPPRGVEPRGVPATLSVPSRAPNEHEAEEKVLGCARAR